MDKETIRQLIEKYLEGRTSLREEEQLREHFNRSETLDDLQPYAEQFRQFDAAGKENNRGDFEPFSKINFEQALPKSSFEEGNQQNRREIPHTAQNDGFSWWMRIAAGLLLLLIGFGTGWYLNSASPPIKHHSHETGQMNSRDSQQTIQEPAHALATTKKALKIVSVNLNIGNKEIQKLAVFNEAQKKVLDQKSIQQ